MQNLFNKDKKMEEKMQKLDPMGYSQQSNQVVEVQFPNGGKNYSYIGGGNLRTGQEIKNAPVTHPLSGKNYTVPKGVKVVATHNVVGAQVGDKKGVVNGSVTSIPVGLKYLPGAREQQQDREIDIKGEKMKVSDYMSQFKNVKLQKLNTFGETGGVNAKTI